MRDLRGLKKFFAWPNIYFEDETMAQTALKRAQLLLIAAMAMAPVCSAHAEDVDPCAGQQLLTTPRPEDSCLLLKPKVYPSPDQAMRAMVFPVGMDLNASADIESRVVIRANDAKLVTSMDYSSPRGTNGYYVARAGWSQDAQFFVYTMSSSGGHSPWSFPTWVFSREKGTIVSLNAMIGGKPTVSGEFKFTGPHTIAVAVQQAPGSEKQVQIAVDLEKAIAKVSTDPKK
jgi:hypothetical protein